MRLLNQINQRIQKVNRQNIILAIAIGFVVIIFGYKWTKDFITTWSRSGGSSPVTVSATTVKKINWQPYLSSVTTLKAVNGVELASQVAGVVNKIFFESGQMIEVGQPLVAMDTSVVGAQLENATSVMNYKKVTFQRYESLYKKGVVSHDQYDSSRSDYIQATALVNQLKAVMNQMTIYAPFSGKLGIRSVNLGQYLVPGAAITSLQQLNPIYADFNIPSQNIAQVSLGQLIEVTVDSYPGKIYQGKITAIDSVIDQDTRGVNVQGTIDNPQNELYPGMFGEIKILLSQQQPALVIPQTAVVYTLYGNSVFVISKPKDEAGKTSDVTNQRYIDLGERQGADIVVTKGLTEGETVVTSGQLKLQNGMTVQIDNSAGI